MIESMNLHYSFTNPATVYDEEAMTALELAGRQSAKINEVIADQNALRAETEEHLEAQDEKLETRLSAQDKAIPVKVDAEMQSRIDDGTFDRKIDAYAGNLEARVDNLLGSLEEGSTTMDAEIIDIRTGAHNETYASAGEAIREQLAQKPSTYDVVLTQRGVNLFDKSKATKGYYLNGGGVLVGSENSFTSDFIPVVGGDTYALSHVDGGGRYVCFYDASYNVLTDKNVSVQTLTENVVTVPNEAHFIRISHLLARLDTFQFEKGTKPTDYYPYYEYEPLYTLENEVSLIPTLFLGKKTGKNLVNKEALTTGYYLNGNGEYIANANFRVTDFIPVEEGEAYAISHPVTLGGAFLCFYNKDKVVMPSESIQGNYYNNNPTENGFTVPLHARYVKCSVHVNVEDVFQIEKGNIQTGYEEYYEYKPLHDLEQSTSKRLSALEAQSGVTVKNRSVTATCDRLTDGQSLVLGDYDAKKNRALTFYAKVGSFSGLTLYHGKTGYSATRLELDAINMTVYHFYNDEQEVHQSAHGLTIGDYISVTIKAEQETAVIIISTASGSKRIEGVWWAGYVGEISVESNGSTLTNCTVSWTCSDVNKEVWLFGDSYFGLTSAERIGYYLLKDGFENWFGAGYAGAGTASQVTGFENTLKMGRPKTAVLLTGMNDADSGAVSSTWMNAVTQFLSICERESIIPVLTTIPSVPGRDHTYKNQWVRNSGYRFIDWEKAVGADVSNTWTSGMLSSDNVHPSELGACALYSRLLADLPEIMN